MIFANILFFVCCALVLHAYWGYAKLLKFIVESSSNHPSIKKTQVNQAVDLPSGNCDCSEPFSVQATVLLTVYNEEEFIKKRLLNLLDCVNASSSNIQILVCSDGSSDSTESIVESMAKQYPCIELFASGKRLGKTGSQNEALAKVRGEIIVFTDAETVFASDCLEKLLEPFANPRIGGTTGALYFNGDAQSSIVSSQQSYWARELKVRECESALGFLCVATGACMAIRRKLYIPPSSAHGEDCVLPLDVVLAGYKMVHIADAIAFDNPSTGVDSEFKSRVRMTERNLTGTFSRSKLLNPLRYPKECFSLVSHKLLKWMTPWLLSIVLICAAIQAEDSVFYRVFLMLAALGCIFACIGYLAEKNPESPASRVPLIASLFSFLLANAGFALGGVRALVGVRTTRF